MEKPQLFFIIVSVFTFIAVPKALEAATVTLTPPTQVVQQGVVEVELTISGLGNSAAPSLGAFDINISFNPTILSFNTAQFGDPNLGDQLDVFDLGSITEVRDNAGVVNLIELSLDSPADLDALQADSFTLTLLTFVTIGVGTTSLDIVDLSLADADGAVLPIDDLVSASVTVVPLPSGLVLLASGIFGVAGFWRRGCLVHLVFARFRKHA